MYVHSLMSYKDVNSIYFETNSTEKSKQLQPQPSLFIQMKICLLIKRKKERWQLYGLAYNYMVRFRW